MNLDDSSSSVQNFSITALMATEEFFRDSSCAPIPRGGHYGNRGRGRGRFHNKGGRNSLSQSRSNSLPNCLCCQICNIISHAALDCFHRMNYSFQGRNPPAQLAAMTASLNQGGDHIWCTDSGATNYITNDLNNLSIHSNYQGTNKVAVGNGQRLRILNSGSSSLVAPNSSFKFNNILHVPDISSNLLSVDQFAKDNNCVLAFDSTGFLIQDRLSGRVLFCG